MPAVRFLTTVILLPAFAASLMAAPVPLQKQDDKELHVVCKARGPRRGADDKVEVKVDRPGKSVTLVLGSNREAAWDVRVTDSTRLVKVVLIGMGKQTVGELPKTTEAVEAFVDRQNLTPRPFIPAAGDMAPDLFLRPMIRQLHTMTGQEVTSFQTAAGMPVVVDKVQNDPQLRSDYPKPEPAEGMPKLEFRALTFAQPRLGMLESSAYAKFTLTGGPSAESRIELPELGGRPPQRINALAVDPAANKGYALTTRREVVELDMDSKATTPLPLLPSGPRNRTLVPRGLAFDTKRGRVLVEAAGQLLAYTPKAGKWEEVRSAPARPSVLTSQSAGLAYQPATDSLYLLTESRRPEGLALQRLDGSGEVVSETQLSGLLFAGLIGPGLSLNSKIQLLAVGDALVLVANVASNNMIERKQEIETYVYLIDPQTGKSRLAWKHLDAFPVFPPRLPQNPAP